MFKEGGALLCIDDNVIGSSVEIGKVYICMQSWVSVTFDMEFVEIYEDSAVLASRFILATDLSKALV
jgi:hypothetical protein